MALNQLSRRKFLQTSSLASALAASDLALPFKALAAPGEKAEEEKVVWSACTVNCGSRCPLRMHVKDNRITYVETDNTGTETYNLDHQVRACLRGRSMRRRVYNPDRLKYPMKRVGKRGEGEFISRAIAMLPILTGNVGIHGGNTGARESAYGLPFVRMPTLTNPVQASIPMFLWTDAIVRGPQMTALTDGIRGVEKLSAPIKFIWNYAGNCLINQHAQINRTHEILQDESQCEMIVTIDNHLTSTAKYSDILLPDCTASEQMDFALDAYVANMNYVIFADQVIQPSFECRNIYQMLSGLAEKLGVKEQFTEGRTQEEWLRHIYAQSREALPELPSFEEFRAQGIFKKVDPNGCFVAYEDFRRDPEKHPLQTPSGKIEIYSSHLAEIAKTWQLAEGDVIDPLPIHVQSFEHYGDPLMEKYPLQLSGFHYKARTHSTYGNVDVLQAANPQEMWINPLDAASRQIKDGDKVRIFNDRGEVRVDAKVTPRIMPGVVGLGEGAWHDADMFGDKIDHAGCINVLTTQRPSPLAKGNPQHSNLVQVERL